MSAEWTLSVSALNEYVRKQLAADPMLRGLKITGEISGYKRHTSGHLYFQLKDDGARIQCVMFRQYAQMLGIEPREGMRVTLTGTVSLFVRDGSYQFYCEDMREEGVGALYRAFEMLKQRLSAEGLFDPSLKKPVPFFPRRVGVVTSPTGAAFQDILRVAGRRCASVEIVIAPAKVQGEGAAREIADALLRLDKSGLCDVIICGRGGGAIEELWAFNEEVVARAIFACQTPVISAVGHETDFTIADFAADLRAPTPSAAAEMAVPSADALRAQLETIQRRMKGALLGKQETLSARLLQVVNRPALKDSGRLFARRETELQLLFRRVQIQAEGALLRAQAAYRGAEGRLFALSPQRVLERGYALLQKEGQVVQRAGQVAPGEYLTAHLADGRICARAEQVLSTGGEFDEKTEV